MRPVKARGRTGPDSCMRPHPVAGSCVEGLPPIAGHDGWRPGLLAAILEESDARRPDSSGVEVFALGEELEVDKVTCPLAALARHGMEFLRDLVVGAHDGHRLGCMESDIGEQVHEVGGQVVLRLVGIADLVVAEFEFHRAPRSAPVVELDVEWLHDVGGRHGGREWRCLLDEPPGEACPPGRKGILEVAAESSERLHPRGVEVLGEPCTAAVAQRHRYPATKGEAVAAFKVPDSLF